MIKQAKEWKHLLIADTKLSQKIEKAQKKYRPYLKSRNYFLIELIEVGLDQLSREFTIHGGIKK